MRTEEEIRMRLEDLKREFQECDHALTQPQSPLTHEEVRQKCIRLYERSEELQWVLGEEMQDQDSK